METTKKNTTQETVLEMVSYQVKPTHLMTLQESLDAARGELMKMEGFISYKTMKSTKESHAFVDLVEWESLAAAEAAAAKVMKTEGFRQFGEAIAEVLTFNHFTSYY